MKHKLMMTIVAIGFVILPSFAQQKEKLEVDAGNIGQIRISGDLDIVLAAASGKEQFILVDPAVSERVSLNFDDNTLTIGPATFSRDHKFVVYVYVNNLKSLI